MTGRDLVTVTPADHGRAIGADEPFVYHCNYYDFWLQNTLLLDESLEMASYIEDAAAALAHAFLTAHASATGRTAAADVLRVAGDQFAEHGFGTIDFSGATPQGGTVVLPTSHYGQTFGAAIGSFRQAQNLFDRGWVRGSLAAAYGLGSGAFDVQRFTCHSLGAARAEIELVRRDRDLGIVTPAEGHGRPGVIVPERSLPTSVDEAAVMAAVATLDFSGNEEGMLPRFGVMLTRHLSNFYNLTSYEFLDRMADTGLIDAGRTLLANAGYHCGFRTFGGIMTSPEWDAVLRPQLRTKEDWVHGLVAIVNCLGWGTARVQEVSPDGLVVRIYDDYESRGYLGSRGVADNPVCFLAEGGYAGLMNLVYVGEIEDRPALDAEYFTRVFEADGAFHGKQTACLATGDEYTEITVSR